MVEETTKQVIEDDPIEVRKAKRAALIEAGENPYGHAFHYTHHLTDLDEKYASLEDGASTEDEVDVAGRIMAKRVQGKIAFFELRDATGDIQLFCRINALGEEVFAAMKDLDVGDWIGVHGTMMRTKRGHGLRASVQVAAPAAGEVPRFGRQGNALSPALCRPCYESRGKEHVRKAL